MEQKDYLLREIEKIGIALRGILMKLTGKDTGAPLALESRFDFASEMLLKEAGFNLQQFKAMNEADSKAYLETTKGLIPENLELLADLFFELSQRETGALQKAFLNKALLILEHCNQKDKTFSFGREEKLGDIKKAFEGFSE